MYRIVLKRIAAIILSGLFGLFVACASTKVDDENALTTIDAGPLDGIWTGEFDIRGRGPYDFTAIHLNEKAYAYSLKAKAMCVGTLAFDGEHAIHKYILFELDGGPFDWATITGTLKKNEQNQNLLASHFKTLNGGDTGALDIAYNEIYNQPSSLELTQGEWTYTDRDNLTTNFSVDKQGTIVGSDSDGCEFLGYMDIINPKQNAYRIKVEIKECSSANGEYEGVSFIADSTLTVQIANSQYALFYAFDRK